MSSSIQANRSQGWSRYGIYLISILALCSLYLIYYPPYASHSETIPISSSARSTLKCDHAPKYKRVAIIGAGSGGASTAYYLARAQATSQIDPCINLTITIFERNSYIGGRSITVQPYISKSGQSESGYPFTSNVIETPQVDVSFQHQPAIELGGSIFVKVNTNLVSAAETLGLSLQSASHNQPGISSYSWAVWDGFEFRFLSQTSDSWWTEARKLFSRYGLAPFWAQRLMKSTVGKFRLMYDAPYFPWSNLTQVVQEVDLESVTGVPGKAYLKLKGISELFSHELIQASTRVNYAQELDQIHGLETMVCLATDGAMSVKGGNWQIFSGMIKSSGAELRLNTSVRAIHSLDESKTGARFGILSDSSTQSGSQVISNMEEFDDVVIATPLQFSKIDTTGLFPVYALPEAISYVKLHVTLLATKNKIGTSYFQDVIDEAPETILTTRPDNQTDYDLPFFSISTLRNLTNPWTREHEFAYKIFSPSAIDEKFLMRLFGSHDGVEKEISWIYRHIWNAYPYLPPRTKFDGPVLGDGLWYTSGIEPFISTMETSSLAGNNVATLLVNSWAKDQKNLESESKEGL